MPDKLTHRAALPRPPHRLSAVDHTLALPIIEVKRKWSYEKRNVDQRLAARGVPDRDH
jgi:hypothetical protein